jgi:hypothetical protein
MILPTGPATPKYANDFLSILRGGWSAARIFEGMSAQREILGGIRKHLAGRVAMLASAIALHAILSVALLPLTTKVLSAADYGTYALFMSIIAVVAAAADGGASLLIPAHSHQSSAKWIWRIRWIRWDGIEPERPSCLAIYASRWHERRWALSDQSQLDAARQLQHARQLQSTQRGDWEARRAGF